MHRLDHRRTGWSWNSAGGKPIKVSEIVAAIKGSNRETVRRHLDTLEKEKFIRRKRTPYGHVIEVLNSHKFGIWKKEKPQNDVSLPLEKHGFVQEKPKSVQEKHGFVVNKEDAAVTQQEDAAAEPPARDAGVWSLLGFQPEEMPPLFRESAEQLYARKNGQPLAEFIGALMEGWKALGLGKHPPLLAQAAKRIREEARNPVRAPIKPLPAIPFQEKRVWQCQTKS